MWRLLTGFIVLVLGVTSVVVALYYAWLPVTPGVDSAAYRRYQSLANAFWLLSCVGIGGGIAYIVYAVRRMNKEYREDQGSKSDL